MDQETLAERLYNVMVAKMMELEPSYKEGWEAWADAKEDGKELFRAMAAYVLDNLHVWSEI